MVLRLLWTVTLVLGVAVGTPASAHGHDTRATWTITSPDGGKEWLREALGATARPVELPEASASVQDVGSTGRHALTDLGAVPGQCSDARLRFPGADNPPATVRAVLDTGFVKFLIPGFPTLVVKASPRIVGAWIGISLLREWRGYPPISLEEWFMFGHARTYHYYLGASDWDEMMSWPADTCEGAFVRHPGNSVIMGYVKSAVKASRVSDIVPAPVPHQPRERLQCDSPERIRVASLTWRVESNGFLYAAPTLQSVCDHTLYVVGGVLVPVYGGEIVPQGLSLTGLKLGPRATYTSPELVSSEMSLTGTPWARVQVEGLDCPERVC